MTFESIYTNAILNYLLNPIGAICEEDFTNCFDVN